MSPEASQFACACSGIVIPALVVLVSVAVGAWLGRAPDHAPEEQSRWREGRKFTRNPPQPTTPPPPPPRSS